jgi:hypothetical protein
MSGPGAGEKLKLQRSGHRRSVSMSGLTRTTPRSRHGILNRPELAFLQKAALPPPPHAGCARCREVPGRERGGAAKRKPGGRQSDEAHRIHRARHRGHGYMEKNHGFARAGSVSHLGGGGTRSPEQSAVARSTLSLRRRVAPGGGERRRGCAAVRPIRPAVERVVFADDGCRWPGRAPWADRYVECSTRARRSWIARLGAAFAERGAAGASKRR